MFKLSDVVGMMMQQGMSSATGDRMKHALGSGASSGGGIGSLLGGLTGGGGVGEMLGSFLGGQGGGIGDMFGTILKEAGQSLGGNQNLAVGGLGSLVGAVLGGGGSPSKSASSGMGAMAFLGGLAFKALKNSRTAPAPVVPLGLREPENEQEADELENNASLVLKAMMSAAKCDGKIDREEIQRILGKLREDGADDEMQNYLMLEMQTPVDVEALCAPAADQQELAAQMYAAALMAIEVDTPTEEAFMQQLAQGLKLTPGTVERLHAMVGLPN